VSDTASKESAELFGRFQILPLFAAELVASTNSVIPRMPFMGVRISWLLLARNSLFIDWPCCASSSNRSISRFCCSRVSAFLFGVESLSPPATRAFSRKQLLSPLADRYLPASLLSQAGGGRGVPHMPAQVRSSPTPQRARNHQLSGQRRLNFEGNARGRAAPGAWSVTGRPLRRYSSPAAIPA